RVLFRSQGDVLDRPDAHVAGEDVWLAEVTKTPGQPGDDDDQTECFGGEPASGVDVVGQPAEGGDELFTVGGDAVCDLADPAQGTDREDRHGKEGDPHHHGLHRVEIGRA